MTNVVCEVCGDLGYKHLLLCCKDCKGTSIHQYCLDEVLYDASLEDWFCDVCRQRHNESSYGRSLGNVSSEMQSSHAQFDSTSHQPVIKRVKSATIVCPHGQRKRQLNLTKGHVGLASSLERVKQPNTLRDTDQSRVLKSFKGLTRKSKKTPQSQTAPFKRSIMKARNVVSGSNEPSNLNVGKSGDELKSMKERKSFASISNNPNESEASKMIGCSVTCEVNSKAVNKPLDTLLVSQIDERREEATIASFQGTSSIDVHFTNSHPNKLHDTLKPKESPNPGSALEHNRIGGTNPDSGIRKLPFSVGKMALNQISGLKDDSGAILSSKHTDQDKQRDQHAPIVCKNIEVNCAKDNRTVVGACQDKGWARHEDKPVTHVDSNSNVLDDLMVEREKKEVRFHLDDHEASNELKKRSMASNAPQPSTLQDSTLEKGVSDSSRMSLLPKENNFLPSNPLDQAYSSSYLDIASKSKLILEASATEVEISDAVQTKDNSRKRRRLVLTYDDDEEEKAEDVRQEDVNHQLLKCNEPMAKHMISEYVEEVAQTGDLNGQRLLNGRSMKRRRRYVVETEDEDDIGGSVNAECALNWPLNDVAKMALQTAVTADHSLQSRQSDSEYADRQFHIYSQPLYEPVWSGVFKIDTEVFLKLNAHLSNKACKRVCELSRSLHHVVEVMMLPRSQAWPERWMSSGPTHDNIGLFFFPRSSWQNEVSTRFINKIIKNDGALKVTVGIADLLIFPSVLLPEQYHFFQGEHYLWGVFRRRKDRHDDGVQVEEQDGSAHASGEEQVQGQNLLDQQDEAPHELPYQETFDVKHYEGQLMVESPVAQKEAMKTDTIEGIASTGSSWTSARPDTQKAGSNCSVQPRTEYKLYDSGDVEQQEEFICSPELNASCMTKQSSTSRPAEHSNKQPHPASEASTPKLIGFIAAQTPRSQQLIQEMVSEGALLFPVPEEIAITASITGSNTEVVSSALNPDTNHALPQAFDFVSTGHEEPAVDPETCLELFPVQQEHIGWAPRAENSREVDLNLSLGKRLQEPSLPPLL